MIRDTLKYFVVFTTAIVLSVVPYSTSYAANEALYLKSADGNYKIGDNFKIDIKGYASPIAKNTATGDVVFPADKLSVSNVSTNGSNYSNVSTSQNSGKVSFNASKNSSIPNSVHIFSITFKAKKAGTASVSFSNTSKINNKSTILNGGKYSITDPNPPKPKPKPKPKPETPKEEPKKEEPKKEEPKPDLNNSITSITSTPKYTSSQVTWEIDAKNIKKVSLKYGNNLSEIDTDVKVVKKSGNSYTANISGLKPGFRYYFDIKVEDKAGNTGTASSSLSTTGYPIGISVTSDDKPLANATVKVNDLSYNTESDGTVNLEMAEGQYSGSISSGSSTKDIEIEVKALSIPKNGSAPKKQTFAFTLQITDTSENVEEEGDPTSFLVFVGILFGSSIVLFLAVIGFISFRRRKLEKSSYGGRKTYTGAVVIDDGFDYSQGNAAKPPKPEKPIVYNSNSVHIDEEMPKDMFEK